MIAFIATVVVVGFIVFISIRDIRHPQQMEIYAHINRDPAPWNKDRGSEAQQEEFSQKSSLLLDQWRANHPEEKIVTADSPIKMIEYLRIEMLDGYELVGNTMQEDGVYYQALKLKYDAVSDAAIRIRSDVAKEMGGWVEYWWFEPIFKTRGDN